MTIPQAEQPLHSNIKNYQDQASRNLTEAAMYLQRLKIMVIEFKLFNDNARQYLESQKSRGNVAHPSSYEPQLSKLGEEEPG